MVISVHCEDEATIRKNLQKQKEIYGDDIPITLHPVIRSEEACYLSSSKAIELQETRGTFACISSFDGKGNQIVWQIKM